MHRCSRGGTFYHLPKWDTSFGGPSWLAEPGFQALLEGQGVGWGERSLIEQLIFCVWTLTLCKQALAFSQIVLMGDKIWITLTLRVFSQPPRLEERRGIINLFQPGGCDEYEYFIVLSSYNLHVGPFAENMNTFFLLQGLAYWLEHHWRSQQGVVSLGKPVVKNKHYIQFLGFMLLYVKINWHFNLGYQLLHRNKVLHAFFWFKLNFS